VIRDGDLAKEEQRKVEEFCWKSIGGKIGQTIKPNEKAGRKVLGVEETGKHEGRKGQGKSLLAQMEKRSDEYSMKV